MWNIREYHVQRVVIGSDGLVIVMQSQDKTLTAPDTRQRNVVKCEFILAGTAKQFIFKMAELPSEKKTFNNPGGIYPVGHQTLFV